MREIKFRAWDTHTPSMMYEVGVTREGFCALSPDKERFILMQYTGLEDKKGKEIYEGDLVWHGRFRLEHPLQVKIGGYWPTEGDCGWGVHVHNEDETLVEAVSAFDLHNGNLEVIGNIYENPELLP